MQDQLPPQGQPQPNEGGGAAQKVIEGIHTDLLKLVEFSSQAAPAVAQKFEAIAAQFQAAVKELLNGGSEPEPSPKGPTQGGPGAVPV